MAAVETVIREITEPDFAPATEIWNSVVRQGKAFPQTEPMGAADGAEFFRSQSLTAVSLDRDSGEVTGLYILHPNNIGRCGHICNASYAVRDDFRGQGIGRALVLHCIGSARKLGFRILQFNAVVASNTAALTLYRSLGFVRLGTIPGGFLTDSGKYEDIVVHYYLL